MAAMTARKAVNVLKQEDQVVVPRGQLHGGGGLGCCPGGGHHLQ